MVPGTINSFIGCFYLGIIIIICGKTADKGV